MNDRVIAAVLNNAHWCDLVCRSHSLETKWGPGFWAAMSRPPRFYPDGITLESGGEARWLLDRIDDGPGCSIKDSYAELDFSKRGLRQLFEASWIFRGAGPTPRNASCTWSVVSNHDELAGWLAASGTAEALRPDLLTSAGVYFVTARDGEGGIAGAALHRTGSVLGISNVFTLGLAIDDVWATLVAFLADTFSGLALVGYEREDELVAAQMAGFTPIGALRVWQRPTEIHRPDP